MKKLHIVALFIFLFANTVCANAAEHRATNPIIWADVPDVSVMRVGKHYYMSSTTMHMSPGLPIMKSDDLVNWKLVSYVYDTLADNDALNLSNGKNAYGKGSWASSLRFHDNHFYVSTFSASSGKTHIFKTRDIEKSEWQETAFEPVLHDHSLFFEDGRVYMVYGSGDIHLVELKHDLTGIKTDGVNKIIINNASEVAGKNIGLPAEGSQLHKINNKYYLMTITWPKDGMRTVLIHRADKLTGPYEGRVALQDEGIAQGGLVDTPDGKWYAMLFGDRGAVGRIPYLVPVTWQDGWPVFGVNGKVPNTLEIPVDNINVAGIVTSDEFDNETLPLAWQWNHNPDNKNWSLSDRPGHMRLTTGTISTNFLDARNTLTQRTFGPESAAEIKIDVSAMRDGDAAGLALLQKHYGYVAIKKQNGKRSLVMVNAHGETPQESKPVPLEQNIIYLKAHNDFRNLKDKAQFSYSLDGKNWTSIGEPLQMKYTLPHFMGYRFGLFNFATQKTGGYVDFDYFRLQ
jgi:beta-xylosidase